MNPQPIHILVVEDNEDDIFLIREAFREAKLANTFTIVRDGEEALEYLRHNGKHHESVRPGLVLLDINMPKKNGFEVLKEIKSDPELRHMPVVMLTTSDAESDILRSYASGACSYVTKPVDFPAFRDVVRQFALYWTLVSRVPGQPDLE